MFLALILHFQNKVFQSSTKLPSDLAKLDQCLFHRNILGDQTLELSTRSPSSSLNQPINGPSQTVYDALTQKLKDNGHLATDDAVDLTVKTTDAVESDDEAPAAPLTIQKVMESIRQKWQNVQQNQLRNDFVNESESDEVLTLRVPQCVKCVVIEREGRKQKFELN